MSEPKSPEEMAKEAITEFERSKIDTSYYVPPYQLPFPVVEETETDDLGAAPVSQVERANGQPNEDFTYNAGGEGGEFRHPFQIIPVDETTWYVYETGSSVINDDDGTSFQIGNLGGNKTGTGFVYVSCEISSGSPNGTSTLVVGGGAPDEVVLNGSGGQIAANLLIAKVENGESFPTICQAWNNAALLSRSFESGRLVWTFTAYPSHPDSLVPPADPDFS